MAAGDGLDGGAWDRPTQGDVEVRGEPLLGLDGAEVLDPVAGARGAGSAPSGRSAWGSAARPARLGGSRTGPGRRGPRGPGRPCRRTAASGSRTSRVGTALPSPAANTFPRCGPAPVAAAAAASRPGASLNAPAAPRWRCLRRPRCPPGQRTRHRCSRGRRSRRRVRVRGSGASPRCTG